MRRSRLRIVLRGPQILLRVPGQTTYTILLRHVR